MGAPRTNYPTKQTVSGLVNELISAIVTLADGGRRGVKEDIEHANDHLLAALELAKRLFRATLEHTDVPGAPPLSLSKGEKYLVDLAKKLGLTADDMPKDEPCICTDETGNWPAC